MRCPDCALMVAYDEPTVEIDDESVSEEEYTADVTVTLPCADCGTELRTANTSFELDLSELETPAHAESCDQSWDIESSEVEATEEWLTKSKRVWRVVITVNLTGDCDCEGVATTITGTMDLTSADFEDAV